MKRYWIIFDICFVVLIIGLFFGGLLDKTSIIPIDEGYHIEFTDSRPESSDSSVVLCVPAAFSDANGIIGHYSTGKGRKGITQKGYTTIKLDNNTHFQQATLIKNGKTKKFSDIKRRFRRALCKKKERFYIVHSKLPVTLTKFSQQLNDYDMAWNLDMGSYSYGWYRDGKGLHHLGLSSYFNKKKQTNWIVVKKNS